MHRLEASVSWVRHVDLPHSIISRPMVGLGAFCEHSLAHIVVLVRLARLRHEGDIGNYTKQVRSVGIRHAWLILGCMDLLQLWIYESFSGERRTIGD